jgi:carbon-monoxide dehydrogenase small subunit
LTVNGQRREADGVGATESLLDVLRNSLGVAGPKNACEQGECGSCSVYLDDVLVCSCLVLAGQAAGGDVVTVEGLAGPRGLDPVQQAFVEAGAVQCGFCTPGLVMAVHDLLRRVPDPEEDQIREALAGNLCRCTGYQKIIDAVRLAAGNAAAASVAGNGAAGSAARAARPSGGRSPEAALPEGVSPEAGEGR